MITENFLHQLYDVRIVTNRHQNESIRQRPEAFINFNYRTCQTLSLHKTVFIKFKNYDIIETRNVINLFFLI